MSVWCLQFVNVNVGVTVPDVQNNQHCPFLFCQLGISEVGIQKALLKWARDYLPEGTSHTSNISLFYTLILSIQQDTKWSLMCECKQVICGHTGHNTTCDVWSLNNHQSSSNVQFVLLNVCKSNFLFNIEVTVKSAVVQNYIICVGWYSWFSLYHFYFQVLIMTPKYLLENDQFSSDRDFRGQLNNVFSLWINSSLIWTIERHIGKFYKWSRV